jgi:N6-adenosine-specific RNA methylase IME4
VNRPLSSIKPFSYDLLVVDPPWDFETYTDAGQKKGPRAQYKTMTVDEVSTLRIGEWARMDSLLLLWATMPLLDRQIGLPKAWGFRFQSVVIWHKVFASGLNAIGTGYRVRSMAEPVIVAALGNPRHRPLPGLFKGIRREHSRKPEEFYSMVEERCPQLQFRADVFGRQSRPGWDVIGDEASKFDGAAA